MIPNAETRIMKTALPSPEPDFVCGDRVTPENAGNKAFMLKRAADMSFAVPPFFVVSVSCMERCMPMEGAAGTEGAEGFGGVMDKALAQEIITRARRLAPEGLFAVRSSGLMEDGKGASFAGQLKTLLRVEAEELPAAVLSCWESARLPGVRRYCAERGLPETGLSMGVIVQVMVEADFSGVIFSANPQGILNEAVIVYGASTGDGVVEDKTPVTSYYFNRTDRVFYYETQPGAPLAHRHNEESRRDKGCDNTLAALAQIGEKAEEGCGFPVDIEYAVKDAKIYVLQVRPITTLDTRQPLILDSSNIAESYPGLSLPLTRSFVKEVYYQVFKGVARRCLPGKNLAERFDGMLREMVGSVNGRMYYQISNWYTVLSFLPFQRKIMRLWRQMMGVQEERGVTAGKASPWQRLGVYMKIFANIWHIPSKMAKLNQEFREVKRAYDARLPQVRSDNSGLLALYDEIAVKLLKNWDITLLNDMYAFVFTGCLEAVSQGRGAVLSGNANLESMKPLRAFAALARQVAGDEALARTLADLRTDEDAVRFMSSGAGFAADMAAYIDDYGDRGPGELKLESMTFRVSPLSLVKALLDSTGMANYSRVAVADTDTDTDTNTDTNTDTDIQAASTDVQPGQDSLPLWRRRLIQYFSRKALAGIAHRETSRLNRSRIFGMVRAIFRCIGQNMAEQGLIENREDIFYLEMSTVFDFVRLDKTPEGGLATLIEKHKKDYRAFADLPAYSRLIYAGEAFDKCIRGTEISQRAADCPMLTGVPCSGGVAEGEALVVHDPALVGETRGKILVAKTTDPGWVFMLAGAGGVIAEKGSLLSHTAIISRELGIPSVVNVRHAASVLRTGDFVRLDGNKGEIEVMSRADAE